MKTVVFIRHAKSSKKTKKLRDIERPLSKRGMKDAPLMSRVLKNTHLVPQVIMSSPAERAIKTAQLIGQEFDFTPSTIVSDPNLYMESKSSLLNTIKQFDNRYDTIFVVSHNPGLTDLVNYLSLETIDNIPTCGAIAIQVDSESWDELDMGNGKMLFFETPKQHRKEKDRDKDKNKEKNKDREKKAETEDF